MIQVAIVEDDIEILQWFQSQLENDEDFNCIGAYEDAESYISSPDKSNADIVIMDIELPGISGIECIRKEKEKGSKSQFLVCTIYKDEENVFNALCAGAVGYILKNIQPQYFYEAIMDAYQGGSPMSGEIARKVVSSFHPKHNRDSINLLTDREQEILAHLSKGYRYKEIADQLFISEKTVRTHIRNIYEKLQVGSRMDAVNKVFGAR